MPFRGDDPFGEIERLFDRMSREFGVEDVARSVAVDLEDRGDAFVVTADVPGFGKEDVDVTLADRTLRIAAEREEAAEAEEGEFLRRERHRAAASRSVRLPEAVEAEDVSATYRHGVLTVTLPKREGGGGQPIDVE